MVSRKRLARPAGEAVLSSTVSLFWGSTAEVSQESKSSTLGRTSRSREAYVFAGEMEDAAKDVGRHADERRLLAPLMSPEIDGIRRVLDVLGRMACDNDVRRECTVSVTERPLLEPGGERRDASAYAESLSL